ncbi:MAG: substrate-binding protein [Desulfobacula sp.]|uniref:substrate-binding protein n=1 Tax=Desulfobacula sp. TaxID=2593537 RepID=UPI0025BDC357|nr:substrate-binding protein [Desulfobacula sp.]MCD4720543.1 substrate-binding protein [Desulfobacula sp.]
MLTRKKIVIGLPIIVILLSAFGAYLFLSKNTDKQSVKIGVVLPLSGDFQTYGRYGVQGAKMAVDEINKAGGVLNGRHLELIIEDNKTDPNIAVKQIRKLIQEDDVIAVVGPVSSTARDAMTRVAKQFKTPLLYGISYEGNRYDRYLFCYSPIPDHVITPIVPFMAKNYGPSFYIFGYDYVWPHEMAEAIKREVKKLNYKISGVEFTPFGIKDFSSTLKKIRKSKADVLMLILPGPDGFSFIRQFNESGLRKHVKIVAIASDETFLQALPPEELEGIITNVHFLSSLESKEAKSFVDRQKKMFGDNTIVTYSTESHYGLIKLLQRAIEKAGTVDREKIVDAMENLTIIVGNGSVTMRTDHHMNLNMVISEFTAGKLIAKKSIGLVIPENQKKGE